MFKYKNHFKVNTSMRSRILGMQLFSYHRMNVRWNKLEMINIS